MRVLKLGIAIVILSSTGCLHTALQKTTVTQASTVTDLRYQQVLDNLAMLAHNPAMMPYYAVITSGLAQVDDTFGGNGSVTWGWAAGAGGSNSQTLGLTGQRNRLGNWSIDPLHDPERLKAMQCVYQAVLGAVPPGCNDCAETIRHFQLDDDLAKMPAGWFRAGGKRDVPKGACYVGCYCDTYVWVTPDGVDGLTRLSLIMLDIATVDLSSLSPATKTVTRKYDKDCKLVEVSATSTIDASDPDCTTGKQPAARTTYMKQRREMVPSIRSLIGGARP